MAKIDKNRHLTMRALPCRLTEDEIELKSAELARVTMEERDHQDAIAAFVERTKTEKKRMDERLAEKRGSRLRLAKEITTRTMDKDVACDWRFDLDSGQAILVRRDTGTAVVRRKMTDDERQMKIGETFEAATAAQLAAWELELEEAAKRGEAIDETPAEPETPPQTEEAEGEA